MFPRDGFFLVAMIIIVLSFIDFRSFLESFILFLISYFIEMESSKRNTVETLYVILQHGPRKRFPL